MIPGRSPNNRQSFRSGQESVRIYVLRHDMPHPPKLLQSQRSGVRRCAVWRPRPTLTLRLFNLARSSALVASSCEKRSALRSCRHPRSRRPLRLRIQHRVATRSEAGKKPLTVACRIPTVELRLEPLVEGHRCRWTTVCAATCAATAVAMLFCT